MQSIEQTISNALAGHRQPNRFAVVGINRRGERFTISYTDRHSADDYAAEQRSNGGTVKVVCL